MTKITFEGDNKTSAMNRVEYWLRHDGHRIERNEAEHYLNVDFIIHIRKLFDTDKCVHPHLRTLDNFCLDCGRTVINKTKSQNDLKGGNNDANLSKNTL